MGIEKPGLDVEKYGVDFLQALAAILLDENLEKIPVDVVSESGGVVVQRDFLVSLDDELLGVDESLRHEGLPVESQLLDDFLQNLQTNFSLDHEEILFAVWTHALFAEVLEESLEDELEDFLVPLRFYNGERPRLLPTRVYLHLILLLHEQLEQDRLQL